MDKLVTLQEVQALVAIVQKATLSPAEQLWFQIFGNRLYAYASVPPPKPEVDLDIKQPGPGQEKDDNGNQE